MSRLPQHDARHVYRDLKPTVGSRDYSIPETDNHELHLRQVFRASPLGFAFGIERRRRFA
jgi:hypothetical protein